MNFLEHDGSVITEPGIYSGLDIEHYHNNPFLCDAPSISSTGLRAMIDRPSMYWAYSPYNPGRFERPESKALDFGKAAHHLLLEGPSGFTEKFALRPETYPGDLSKKWSSNATECRRWLEYQAAKGRTVITQEDLDTIEWIRDSLAKHPAIRGGILEGEVEKSMLARHGKIWLRARPDIIPIHAGDFSDLKTTNSIAYSDLERTIAQLGYHVQAALVRMLAEMLMPEGFKFQSFFFIFVEKTPPFDIRIVELADDAIDFGKRLILRAIKDFETCIERQEWPGEEGFSPGISKISLPAWAKARQETELAYKEALE